MRGLISCVFVLAFLAVTATESQAGPFGLVGRRSCGGSCNNGSCNSGSSGCNIKPDAPATPVQPQIPAAALPQPLPPTFSDTAATRWDAAAVAALLTPPARPVASERYAGQGALTAKFAGFASANLDAVIAAR